MTTDALPQQLLNQEGYRQKPYKDSLGNWTGGVGHLLSTTAIYDARYDFYSYAQWMGVLANDVDAAERRLDRILPWWRKLSDVRQDVMVCLAFNVPGFTFWKHTIGDIEQGNFKAAEIDLEHDEPWANQVKGRAQLLAKAMETGEWPK